MSTETKIRCHQFLAGRFHEGYGRTEVSREDDHGRRKTTINYEGINLDGRNNFFFDGYQAYEIEPTHADWRGPGVFCITNGIENGSQAARTYGLIPASGNIDDAFAILREKPVLSLEEFSEYDLGRKVLTWKDVERTPCPKKKYIFTDAARERLGRFLTVYWSTMSIRMMEPDSHDVVALHLSCDLPDGTDLFQEQVDFFYQEVVCRYPKAVQVMTSVAFSVPWTQRRMHPATACIVTSDEKDLSANPIYSFVISYVNGQYEVDVGRTYRGNETAEKEGASVAEILMGDRAMPRIYRNMEDLFSIAEGGDHVILRTHEVLALLAQIGIKEDRWFDLSEDKRRNEARKIATEFKNRYDILYKTLRQNCNCQENDTYRVLLPLLDALLETMSSVDEGTEFENVFTPADIPFFAGCLRLNEAMPEKNSEGKRRSSQLEKMLVDNYSKWSEQGFRCNMWKGKEEDLALPYKILFNITQNALADNTEINETIADQTREYFRNHYPQETANVARIIYEWQGKHLQVDKAFYEEQQEWLRSCGIRDEKVISALLLPIADKLMEDEEAMQKVGVEFVGEHMDMISRASIDWNEKEREKVNEIIDRESGFLLQNFAQWRKTQYESGMTQRKSSEQLENMVERWQKENLENSQLSSEELNSILNSLINVKKEDGSKLDLECLKRHILFIELEEAMGKCTQECTQDSIRELAGKLQKTRGKEEKADRYQALVQNAQELLAHNYSVWRDTDFQAGDQEADSGLIDITEKWLELISRSHSETLLSAELKDTEKKLIGESAFVSEEGQELLTRINDACFVMMQNEASKTRERVDADSAWWERLKDFYEKGDLDEEDVKREWIVRQINEACGRKNPYANQIMMEILQNNHNMLPRGASKQSRWNEARRTRLNEATQKLLSRFKAPEDFAENKLSLIWAEEYSEDYSANWSELREQADFEDTVKSYLQTIYDETELEERINLLRALWKVAEKETAEETNGFPADVQNFVVEKLIQDYNELWRTQGPTGRANLDRFADEIQKKHSLSLEKTQAGMAKSFLEDYQRESPMSLNEAGKRIKELTRRPEWLSWISWNEMDDENSAIERACQQHDVSAEGIGHRLIRSLTADKDAAPGAYWKDVVQDVTGVHSSAEMAKVKLDSADSGKILNALSWLSHTSENLDKAGGCTTMADLAQWLQNAAPDLMNSLRDEKALEGYWGNWQEIFPQNLLNLVSMKK